MNISPSDAARVTNLEPHDVAERVRRGEAVLIDVRELDEIDRERIDGADVSPLSVFDPPALRDRHRDATLIFQCRIGQRSIAAALAYGVGDEPLFHLRGGIEGWKAAGLPVVRGR
ncbi:MAG: rhodanese-like domain-containing protein [Planctomycetota bacterium]